MESPLIDILNPFPLFFFFGYTFPDTFQLDDQLWVLLTLTYHKEVIVDEA